MGQPIQPVTERPITFAVSQTEQTVECTYGVDMAEVGDYIVVNESGQISCITPDLFNVLFTITEFNPDDQTGVATRLV